MEPPCFHLGGHGVAGLQWRGVQLVWLIVLLPWFHPPNIRSDFSFFFIQTEIVLDVCTSQNTETQPGVPVWLRLLQGLPAYGLSALPKTDNPEGKNIQVSSF